MNIHLYGLRLAKTQVWFSFPYEWDLCRSSQASFFMRGPAGCAFFYWEENIMDEKTYFEIFNKITDMIEELKQLQIQMEESYISKPQ